jgi:hypothetical protein
MSRNLTYNLKVMCNVIVCVKQDLFHKWRCFFRWVWTTYEWSYNETNNVVTFEPLTLRMTLVNINKVISFLLTTYYLPESITSYCAKSMFFFIKTKNMYPKEEKLFTTFFSKLLYSWLLNFFFNFNLKYFYLFYIILDEIILIKIHL